MSKLAFTTILVANRGEIACRVILAARSLGYGTVAVYSDADKEARHVALADKAVRVGPAPAAQSYLVTDRIIEAAKASGADAIHPGYGFLSENPDFAEACATAGIVFIGPSADAIRAMGNKAAAKRLMIEAGVPCIPGYQGEVQDDKTLMAASSDIGFPIMVKAAAGGGGRGMRLVENPDALPEAIIEARREAIGAFGSDELILERAVIRPRHVEIQVMADRHGTTLHFGERDCSVQRRHQKVVEEAPCPVLDEETRDKMGEAAIRAAQSIHYHGAGTVEFLLDASGEFFFLEMNTRIQVEHPVTELITGVDLVAMQIRIAAGEPLGLTQADVVMNGHAIEVRVYAEDPANDFLPQTGCVSRLHLPEGSGLRIDHGLTEGGDVTPFYDPMLAKVIAYGQTREEARRRLVRALSDVSILGVTTNRDFLSAILTNPVFIAGDVTTDFLATQFSNYCGPDKTEQRELRAMAAVLLQSNGMPAGELANWWSTGEARSMMRLAIGDDVVQLAVHARGNDFKIIEGENEIALKLITQTENNAAIERDGVTTRIRYAVERNTIAVDTGQRTIFIEDQTYLAPEVAQPGADGKLRAPMNGSIAAVNIKVGDTVKRGETMVVLEAMKMMQPVVAPSDGVIEAVSVEVGAQVATRQILVTMIPAEQT